MTSEKGSFPERYELCSLVLAICIFLGVVTLFVNEYYVPLRLYFIGEVHSTIISLSQINNLVLSCQKSLKIFGNIDELSQFITLIL